MDKKKWFVNPDFTPIKSELIGVKCYNIILAMKIFVFLISGILLIGFGLVILNSKKPTVYQKQTPPNNPTVSMKAATKPSVLTRSRALFVPYWSLNQEAALPTDQYGQFIYFGVLGGEDGVTKDDPGYKDLQRFVSMTGQKKNNILAIRMVDHTVNTEVLADLNAQNRIIDDATAAAKQFGFGGILLDFELSTTFNTSAADQFNVFVQQFYTQTKIENLKFYITLYGDTFYTKRPYDVFTLAKNVDVVMIMAYDLHKAGGEPGPNFPLGGNEKYGYDLAIMVNDFLRYVPADKITVIFGMYGYDWSVDEKKRPITTAETLSLNDIRKKFLGKCTWQDCTVTRDDLSQETEVDYVTSEIKDNFAYLYYHIVWFEDEQSAEAKMQYINKQGIGNVAYWAYGYF